MSVLASLRRAGARLSDWTERWVPDAWVLCLALTALVLALATTAGGASPHEALVAWGDGVWSLLALAMQFTIAFVAAAGVATSRPAFRALDALAALPDPERPRQAIALAGVFSIATGLVNGAVCTVASALLVPFVARRNPKVDVRVLIVAAYLGLGTVWHGGLSGTAPLILATPHNPLLEPATGAPVVDRLYPVTETLGNAWNALYLAGVSLVALAAVVLLHPDRGARTLTREQIDAILPEPPPRAPRAATPAARLDAFPGFNALAALLLLYPLGARIAERGFGASWTIDAYNTVFLSLALVLHVRPLAFVRGCLRGLEPAYGLVLQFPFYGGIFGVLVGTGTGAWLAAQFVRIAERDTYALLVYLYSGLVNLVVPSAGSKFLIEAPYLIPVGNEIGVSTVTTLLAYAYGDSTTNLIQPMWALPLLAVTRTRFGEVVGYAFLVALACLAASAVWMLWMPTNL
ncbi:MAG: short-chain fatty acid transporter [Myxococcales bacterium]|nr:short-chain fatty acid transporter [Myxococcales bacterium]